jgi:hypothetical protein
VTSIGKVEGKGVPSAAIRRLAHRPSIAVWNSCNECSASGLYVSFVMTLVAEEDLSRPIWPGCPSSGWASGVHRLTGLPNGQKLSSTAGGSGFRRLEASYRKTPAIETDTETMLVELESGTPLARLADGTGQAPAVAVATAVAETEAATKAAGAAHTCTFEPDTGYQNAAGGKRNKQTP